VSLLRDLGYTNVRHYAGGLTEWFQSGDSALTINRLDTVEAPSGGARRVRRGRGPATRFLDALGEQSVGALFGSWIALVTLCAVAYWLLGWSARPVLVSSSGRIGTGLSGLLSAFYFSSVTATSVGYGDIVPYGAARVIAVGEAVAGLVIFGCVVSKFVSRRQEELIGEIHHIAFEERLGRVRTNLLLVRAELQATARLCEGRDMTPPEAVARVESAAMVFVGEMHAVHDLLYRPQNAPDEAVLEAILAGLTSVFREFNDLLTCVQMPRAQRSRALAGSISTMARLAKEICGDCVPREFAPSLRSWMDQIQRMAGEVERI
jgi:ion channel